MKEIKPIINPYHPVRRPNRLSDDTKVFITIIIMAVIFLITALIRLK